MLDEAVDLGNNFAHKEMTFNRKNFVADVADKTRFFPTK